ncbi:TonB-dependent receptor [Henriciella aquimarina]|uniref:TonB-dependent receptor n=1 Tax=Henriciella aquimarina TaxID=545261 RepID=UPI001F46A044|nr:TonB-dependent receptor [Henriciella aquimarina]
MIPKTPEKYLMLAGASALALSWAGPSATAQTQDDAQRKLGTVLVTTQKTEESIQDVPIAVSAFDEEALEKLQLTGGPDLTKSIPNVSFTKGNFTSYNFKIRGIGADLVAQSGDAGVGVHQNDVPLTANRLFEAEFYDVERVETLRGPQGTLYGRNATGGVINVITAKPVMEEFQGDLKLTYGNYNTFKAKGMFNMPIGDRVALRVAGSMMQRDGYVDNVVTGNDIDDRDLYGIRATLAFEPTDRLRGWVAYEHFEEEDSRLRSGKQFCSKDPLETSAGGIPISPADQVYTSLGCQDAPLDQSNDRVNSVATLGGGLGIVVGLLSGDAFTQPAIADLRTIESSFDPDYYADQDLFTWKGEFDLTDSLLLTYLGSYGESSIRSIEDYNKVGANIPFNEAGIPLGNPNLAGVYQALFPGGVVTDPQLGASNFFQTFDLSGGSSEQTTHEVRLQSDFEGRFNFNVGAISIDYEAVDQNNPDEGYYVFSNTLTALTQLNNALGGAIFGGPVPVDTDGPSYGPLMNLGGDGGNYFRSLSPYKLESFAVFGEGYFDITDNLQLTVGLRYTDDDKSQENTPTFLFTPNDGSVDPLAPQPVPGAEPDNAGDGTYNVSFQETTGRIGLDWSPDLSFSDDTLIYAFYSKGYKGGGINPPQPAGNTNAFPQFFDPEFINSYEIGTKNTLANGALQLNATGFYYDYEGYQITQIVNRSSANFNIDAKLQGLEFETIWNPASTFVINANLGLLDTEIQDTFAIDVLDRTNGRADMTVLKNASSYSNCVVSTLGYQTVLGAIASGAAGAPPPGATGGLCNGDLARGVAEAVAGDPNDDIEGTGNLQQDIAILEAALGLSGESITYVDSNGELQTVSALTPFDGEAKDLDGNEIPGAPEMTLSIGAEYTWDSLFNGDWAMRIRGDYYYQADSLSRVWNTARDDLDGWSNVNLSLQFYNDMNGLELEIFGKNITDEEVITGAYLTDDSSGLYSNAFLNEPRLYGVSVRKRW